MVVWFWIGFIVFVLLMLALDLGVLNRKARVVPTRQALIWSGFCALLALGFSVFVYFLYEWGWMPAREADGRVMTGKDAAIQFLTGWLIEQSLSLDNIFVIALIFAYFRVPPNISIARCSGASSARS